MKNFSQVSKPINDLIIGRSGEKNNARITWTEECQKAFDELKKQITSGPILQLFNSKRETFLQVDSSSYATGAMLLQRDETDNNIKPVAFYSEKLPQLKRHLTAYDLELLGVAKALKHFRRYLFMRPVTIITDHKNLLNNKVGELCLRVRTR